MNPQHSSDTLTLGAIVVVALAIIGLSVFIGMQLAPRPEATVIREVVTATARPGPPIPSTPRPIPTAPAAGIVVTRVEYGDAWPLTVSEARLECRGSNLVAVINGVPYALNGIARARYDPIDRYWRDDPAIPGLKVVITPLIERAQGAC